MLTIDSLYIHIGLALLASISPLLTLTGLWQLKEWRIDRLAEHCRQHGTFRQLWGILRPSAVGVFWLAGKAGLPYWDSSLLTALAALACVQIITRRQRTPIWTTKAKVLTVAAIGLDILLAIYLAPSALVVLLPVIQPVVLALSWLLFLPVDHTLKQRILNQAKTLREQNPDMQVIAITGSVGKTTTKELLAHILAPLHAQATPAYVNSELGVANWLISTLSTNAPPLLIVEMGAYKAGEIRTLCSVAQPQSAVLTYIGRQHLALFGSEEALQNAKAEILEDLPADGHAYLNADNERCAELRTRTAASVTLAGTGGTADIEAFAIEETGTGIRFQVDGQLVEVPLHGTHNVVNVLLAIAVARDQGMNDKQIINRLQSFTPPSSTFAVEQRDHGITMLDDTHNASEASFKAAIAWARTQPAKQKVLLTSGLIELGPEDVAIHRELGGAAATVFDRVICTQPKSKAPLEQGFGRPIELYNADTPSISADTLLVCVGRVPKQSISRLLQQ